MSTIFIVALIFLTINHLNADNISFGSTRGCNSTCQKECIEVINKYRLNHQAKEVQFSQVLADKAQKWADGGKFGYDMKSRGKYGQLIEWDVKDELQNFTTVIKHWHDKEKDFDFASGQSRTGKTLHDFTQIVWKKARKAGCGQSVIFGSKYYVVWMDSDGIVSPDVQVGAANIGTPEKNDLHWFEAAVDSSKRKPTYVLPSRLREEASSTRDVVDPEGPTISATGKFRSDQSKPINAPDLNEVQEEQRVLNNNAMLKQYLYHDSLNNVVMDENKETASYHVVPGAEDKANWQKGAESLIQLDKNKPKTSKGQQMKNNGGVESFPADEEDDRKDTAKFQSLVIQDDDMLTKGEGEVNETIPSEGNGGDDLEEGDERKQAAALQSMMKQEDDMIQHQDDEDEEESSGNKPVLDTTVSSNNSKSLNNDMADNSLNLAAKLQEKPTSYYSSGVALNNNPNVSAASESNELPSLNSTGDSMSSSLHGHLMTNQSFIDNHHEYSNSSPSSDSLTNGQKEGKAATVTEAASTALPQSDKTNVQLVTNVSSFQSFANKVKTNQTTLPQSQTMDNANKTDLINGGKNVGLVSSPNVLTSQNGTEMTIKPQIGSMANMTNSHSRVQLAHMLNPGNAAKQAGPNSHDSRVQATSTQPQQTILPSMNLHPVSAVSSGLKIEESTLVSNNFPQSNQTKELSTALPSTETNDIKSGSTSISDAQHVTSPAVITLPSSNTRPIKLVFHVKDTKSKETLADGTEAASAYQPTLVGNNVTHSMDSNECHDDTLHCHMWAHHGHCRGIAYAEFMKRHCKATCGYCGFPSVIRESVRRIENSNLVQDEPCNDAPSYEFSCPRWQAQGYCEKRQKEMNHVCRKTCGFCEPRSRPPSSLPHSPPLPEGWQRVNEVGDKSNPSKPVLPKQQATASSVTTKPKAGPSSSSQRLPPLPEGWHRLSEFKDWSYPRKPILKQQATASLGNKKKTSNQMDIKTPSLLPSEQSVTAKVNRFIKMPAKVGLKSLGASQPQVAATSFSKNVASQQFSTQEEDKVIENGIKALQQRLQAPLEISAVAKSNAECGERLCKEKVKTQQAKAREIISNRGTSVSPASKTGDRAVATKGCDVACQQECLAAHNRYRLNHGAAPLVLDQTLADQAQQWADKKVFKHSPWAGGQGGETIALGSLYPSFTAAVKAWHDEEKDYNWSTGTGESGMKVSHFTQVVWKKAHLLGCGKTFVNGEPYYIAQMDTPGVIASVPGFDKSNVGQPKQPDLKWFMDSSPYWKEMQAKDSIPKNIEHRILR